MTPEPKHAKQTCSQRCAHEGESAAYVDELIANAVKTATERSAFAAAGRTIYPWLLGYQSLTKAELRKGARFYELLGEVIPLCLDSAVVFGATANAAKSDYATACARQGIYICYWSAVRLDLAKRTAPGQFDFPTGVTE